MAPITASRIEALLLPQNWEDGKSWHGACEEVLSDLRAADADVHKGAPLLLPNLAEWTGSERPQCNPGENRILIGMEFINPLFAWVCIVPWFNATESNVDGLFHLLMRCGCDSAKVLDSLTSSGRSILQYAALFASGRSVKPLSLLLTLPKLSLFNTFKVPPHTRPFSGHDRGPFCCAMCTMLCNGLDDAAMEVLKRMTPEQRLVVIGAPHWGLVRAIYKCNRTCKALWDVVRDRVVQPDCDDAEVDRLVGGPAHENGYYSHSVLTQIISQGNISTWQLVTNEQCPLATALIRHANAHPQGPYANPLQFYSWGDDIRGAWLVPRLSVVVLNSYNRVGRTPLMHAVKNLLPKTLTALLDRGIEVDLCAQMAEPHTAQDAWPRTVTKFTTMIAVDFLPPQCNSAFTQAAMRLRAETKVQLELRPLISAVAVPVLQQIGGARMPRELVQLCLEYANLPIPAAFPAPTSSVSAGAKRKDAAGGGGGAAGGGAGGGAAGGGTGGGGLTGTGEPGGKRLRLT